ncbi:hypothetical protein A7S34_18460 [Salmonella enterica]|uniref:Uncharacterized protein n=26 Tax=Salmonella enterica I TaxID=59201 RepID=G5R271_SALSE|nr:hypothetical protein SEETH391_07965 [Salmonella enterica subsp. enterica serovar Thompson str. ATCC 8391]ALG99387.1 hypothetical protein STho1984_2164 [Salmonella enterica subsp. enterica serovar Thompson]APX28145.1 hypothetical protein BFF41_09005 [Salmonella enterica subsp. enterica serovar Senftenberg]EDX47582.1 conserved hypothetical protein [Salmonella enterica subsp. enterica serovar Kentucky str. CVM29188]EDZ22560.1 conserved hypothetical protein [Salmonella enterica subsp. enterica s
MKCCALIALPFFFLLYAAVSEAWFKANGDKRDAGMRIEYRL